MRMRASMSPAAQVITRDLEVDTEFLAIMRQLISYMMEDPRTISAVLDVVFVRQIDRAYRRSCKKHRRIRGARGSKAKTSAMQR